MLRAGRDPVKGARGVRPHRLPGLQGNRAGDTMKPVAVGNAASRTPTQLAEAAIDMMKRGRTYGVGMDLAGRIVLAHPDHFHPQALLMACNSQSDPDVLADNIRDEVNSRDPGRKHRAPRETRPRKRA